MSVPVIKKLDETVVNRIAAGEVVQRPSAAIKEMLENCLDAGSTQITVTVKGGGIDLLQIQDNGHGIRRDDLAIVCERFTTSKLTTFEDLQRISTFGFRGEALASITHVAHVTITTRTADSPCAYKAKYLDGKLVPIKSGDKPDPKPCAGNVGTTITVEDLFYNMQTRRQAFKNASEQYQRILDVVTKYSVHFGDQKVSFTCKKQGQGIPDLHTPVASSTLENIKIAYGAAVARELQVFELSCGSIAASSSSSSSSHATSASRKADEEYLTAAGTEDAALSFSMKGYISNANYSNKKATCILFINNRLVECQSIKKVIDTAYADILPRHSHPFTYLSIRMPPQHVDVNVHPTKKEVHFMHEEELLEKLFAALMQHLRSANESRTFYTQSVLSLPGMSADLTQSRSVDGLSAKSQESSQGEADSATTDKIAPERRGNLDREDGSQPQGGSSQSSNSGANEEEELQFDGINRHQSSSTATIKKSEASSKGGADTRPTGLSSFAAFSSSNVGEKRKASETQPKVAYKLVRTDHTLQKIDTIFRPTATGTSASAVASNKDGGNSGSRDVATTAGNDESSAVDAAAGAPAAEGGVFTAAMCGVCAAPAQGKKGITSRREVNSVDENDLPVENLAAMMGCECCRDRGTGRGRTPAESGGTLSSSSIGQVDTASAKSISNRAARSNRAIVETDKQYMSIKNMIAEIKSSRHDGLEQMLKALTFVGVVDGDYSCIQSGTKLLLLDHTYLARELFYQLAVRQFAVVPRILLGNPVPVREYLIAALDCPEAAGWEKSTLATQARREKAGDDGKEKIATAALSLLTENAEMLDEYFRIGINEDGRLCSLPELLPGYTPTAHAIPLFLLRLATEVNWDDEELCFRSIARELALFFSKLPCDDVAYGIEDADSSTSVGNVSATEKKSLHATRARYPGDKVAEIIASEWIPSMKAHLIPSRRSVEDSVYIEIAALEQLYKIFERC